MKAVILAAGRSSRLKRAGFDTPKHLILFDKKPLILYILQNLKKSGIKEVGIVVARDDTETCKILGDGRKMSLKIEYITQDNPQGTAMAIKCARKFVKDEAFLVHLGSDIFENNFGDAIKVFIKEKFDVMVTIHKAKDIHLHGMAIIDNGKVKRVVEKPEQPVSNWVLTGCYFFTEKVFDAIDKTNRSTLKLNKNEVVVTDVIQTIISSGLEVFAYEIKGWWEVLRTREGYNRISRFIDKSIN